MTDFDVWVGVMEEAPSVVQSPRAKLRNTAGVAPQTFRVVTAPARESTAQTPHFSEKTGPGPTAAEGTSRRRGLPR